jgi:hypothetical protein
MAGLAAHGVRGMVIETVSQRRAIIQSRSQSYIPANES